MKPVKDPFMTTIRGLKNASGSKTREALRQIEQKIVMHGIISERETEFWNRYNKIDQKEPV